MFLILLTLFSYLNPSYFIFQEVKFFCEERQLTIEDVFYELYLFVEKNNLELTPVIFEYVANFILNNSMHNGLPHVARIHVLENRLISIPELQHLTNIDAILETRLSKKIKTFDHPMYLKSLSNNEVISCMYTSQFRTDVNGLGSIYNIKLKESSFKSSNGIFHSSSFNFFFYFQLLNDVNYLPKDLQALKLDSLAAESFYAYEQVWSLSDCYYTFDEGCNSFIKKDLSFLDKSVLSEVRNFDQSLNKKNVIDKEIKKVLKSFEKYEHYNFKTGKLVKESRRLMD